jgi:hypothetical protein
VTDSWRMQVVSRTLCGTRAALSSCPHSRSVTATCSWRCLATLALLLLQATTAFARDPGPAMFHVYTAGGTVATGSLEQLGNDWSVALNGDQTTQISGSEVIALRHAKIPLPPTPREPHVRLSNGDCFPGTPLRLSGERVRFTARLGSDQELSLPLSAVTLFWFAAPDGVEDGAQLCQRLASQRRKRDMVLLRNGDLLEGTLAALDTETVQIDQAAGKRVRVTRDKIAAIALSTELARSLRTKGVYARLVLANGSRMSLLSARADRQALEGKTLFGATIQVPVNQLVALDLRQGRVVYLSDLKPSRYEHTPYLGVRWPYTLDASVAGNQLRVGGSTYDKGIGMHSQSRLAFNLSGGYQWFEARVGLDDRTGRNGNVLVQVLVDGKPQDLGAAGELNGPEKPLRIRVPVARARELTLVVLFGRRGDVQDHVDWADARLIK